MGVYCVVKHRKIRRSNLLRRYVSYNLCFVLIPVILLASVYYVNTKKQIIKEYELTHQYALDQTKDSIERRLNEFSVIAGQMSKDTLLTPFEMSHSYYGKIVGIDRLKTYFARTDFLDDIMLYYYGDDELYGSGGANSLKTFTDVSYDFVGQWDFTDFMQLLKSKKRFDTSPYQCYVKRKNGETNNLIVITTPCPPSAVSVFGTIVGFVNHNFFQSLLDAMPSDVTSSSFILDGEKRILFTTGDSFDFSQNEMIELTTSITGSSTYETMISGKRHSVLVKQSQQIGWYYVTVFPHDQFSKRFFSAQTPLLMIIIILCIMGIAFAVLLAFKNYRPIQKIYETLNINQLFNQKSNELLRINQAVQEIINNNQYMKTQLDDNKAIVIQSHLMNLLNGQIDENYDTLQTNLEQIGKQLSGPYFCVMVIRFPAKIKAEIRENIINILNTTQSQYAYALDIQYRNLIAVVFSLSSNDMDLNQLANNLSKSITTNFEIQPQIGVGQRYKKITQINESYVEAITAVETIIDDQTQHIIFFDGLLTSRFSGSYWYPSKDQLRLLQALRQGNIKSVNESIGEMYILIKSLCLPHNSIRLRFITSSIIIQLMPLIEDLKLDDSDQEINTLIHHAGLEDFFMKLKTFCQKLVKIFEDNKKREREELFDRIIAYIDKHYSNHSISLNSISDQFDITPSYLSRFFKENASVNFIDYLTDKRMTQARKLLLETDMKVRDIMEQVGYLDLASFTRKFTQLHGISPGRYRKEMNR